MNGDYIGAMSALDEADTARRSLQPVDWVVIAVAAILVGFVPRIIRIAFYADPFDMSTVANLILHAVTGLIVGLLIVVWQWRRRRRRAAAVTINGTS